MDYLNDDKFVKFTHKLYPDEEVCLLPNKSFKPVSWHEDLNGINWKFQNSSIIRTSGVADCGVVEELITINSPMQFKSLMTDLGYYE